VRCVQVDANGFVVDVVPQPADVSTCALVLATPNEIISPLRELAELSAADAALISTAVVGIWLVGWAISQAGWLGSQRHD